MFPMPKAMRAQIILVLMVFLISLPWVIFGPNTVTWSLARDDQQAIKPVSVRHEKAGTQWTLQFELSRPIGSLNNLTSGITLTLQDASKIDLVYPELYFPRRNKQEILALTGFSERSIKDPSHSDVH